MHNANNKNSSPFDVIHDGRYVPGGIMVQR
jgi:hypothetical protein